jgi:hypothetical protein
MDGNPFLEVFYVSVKKNCKHCYGLAFAGMNLTTKRMRLCDCVRRVKDENQQVNKSHFVMRIEVEKEKNNVTIPK